MKYLMVVLMVVLVVCSTSCSRFSFSVGAGYRSVPPTLDKPILNQLKSAEALGVGPIYIEMLIKFLEAGGLEALFHEKNRTDLGFWVDFMAAND